MKLNEKIHKFILNWNKNFPIDYWWRKKYNVPFGSKRHREMSFFDMLIDYEEEKSLLNLNENNNLNDKEVDELFDSLDLNEFND